MSDNRMRRSRGFTLIELMVTIAVLAIALAVTVPSFREFVRRNHLAAATNNVASALALARSEAVKRATRVTVAPSSNWTSGWQVFVDDPVTGTVGVYDAGETLLRVYEPSGSSSAAISLDDSSGGYVSYLPTGVSDVNGSAGSGDFEVCIEGTSRVISIINTGRVSTAPGTC